MIHSFGRDFPMGVEGSLFLGPAGTGGLDMALKVYGLRTHPGGHLTSAIAHRLLWRAMIRVRSVSKSFGRVRAVRDVTFEVGRDEVVGLLGANGAGKTTTIRM